MSLGEFGGVVGTAVKMGNINLHHVVATFTDGSGGFTQDLTQSSPGCVLTRTAQGNYTVTLPLPRQQVIMPLYQNLSRAVQLLGSSVIFFETLSITLGTCTYAVQVAGSSVDTDPASGDVLRVYILTGGF